MKKIITIFSLLFVFCFVLTAGTAMAQTRTRTVIVKKPVKKPVAKPMFALSDGSTATITSNTGRKIEMAFSKPFGEVGDEVYVLFDFTTGIPAEVDGATAKRIFKQPTFKGMMIRVDYTNIRVQFSGQPLPTRAERTKIIPVIVKLYDEMVAEK